MANSRPTYTGGRTVYDGTHAVTGERATYTGAPAVSASAAAPPAKKSGGGIFGNLLGDVEHTLTGIGPGIAKTASAAAKDTAYYATGGDWTHPKGGGAHTLNEVAKPIAQSYEQTYAPLVQGRFGQFFHGVAQHPLGPILDLATVATLGAGGAAKAGQILAKAGAISDASRLANLGKAVDLTAPDFAKQAGQKGEDVTIKQSSANPLIRARQQTVNAGLNKLPPGTPVVGSSSRIVKALSRAPERASAALKVVGQPFEQAFAKLNPAEQAAWHLSMRAVHPTDYKAFLANQMGASPAMLKILDNPAVAALVEKPTPNLADALAKGHAISDHLTGLKVQAAHITDQAAAESPYRLLRLVNGAKYDDSGALVDQPGREIPVLAKELAAAGKRQPSYVPDSAVTGRAGSVFSRKPTGLAEPAISGASKQSRGILASKGMLAFNENPLARELGRFANHTQGSLLHDELVKHAAQLPHGMPLPNGYEYLKLNRGEGAAPYTERVRGQFEHALDPGTADRVLSADGKDGEIATHPQTGQRLIVPSNVRQILENKTLTYNGALHHLLYNQPTAVWKHLVLGLRPAFFGNITVGNSVLGALQMAPGGHGLAGWLNQVVPGAEHVLGSKLTPETMGKVLPEQRLGTFGHTMGFGGGQGASKLARGTNRLYQGVMPPTIAYENKLRLAMAEGWAKAMPAVRAEMHANGGDVNAALERVAQTHPQVIDQISKRIDDALGNYRTYNKFERAIKQFVPFYGWDRHIVRSIARLSLEHPARLDALLNVGAQGHAGQQASLGDVPSYMQGDVKLPGLPGFMGPENGRTPLLSTHSLNPFNTVADLLKIPQAVSGKAGGQGSEILSSGLNPIVQALIEQATGRSLLSGAPIKTNAFANAFENIPQVSLVQAARGKLPPTTPTSLYQNDWQSKLAAFLGAAIKKTNLQTAHYRATQEQAGRR